MENLFLRRNITLLHNVLTFLHNNGFKTTSWNSSSVPLVYKVYGNDIIQGGDDAPIIILHGLLGSKRNWHSMAGRIEQSTKKTVIAVDQRNHGDSMHVPSHSYLDLAEDVGQLLRDLRVKKVNLIGHSMGGRAAMAFALTQAAKVSSLVVVDISPVSFPSLRNDFFPRLMDAMSSVQFDTKDLSKARQLARDALKKSGVVKEGPTLNFILTNVGKKGENVGWKCNVSALRENWKLTSSFPSELLTKTYTGPSLFLAGRKSEFVPEADEKVIKQFFPQAQLIFIEDAGHNIHMEKPDQFLQLTTQFLNNVN